MSGTTTIDNTVAHGKLPQRVSIHCVNGCGTLSRVYRTVPTTQIGAFKYCPVCGASIMAYLSADDNGWEALAAHYGMDVQQIRAIYAGWSPHEFYRFSDYVDAMREEARTGVPQPHKPYPYKSIPVTPAQLRAAPPVITTDPPPRLPRMKVPT